MRAVLFAVALIFAVSACGKKAPLRPPEEPQDQESRARL